MSVAGGDTSKNKRALREVKTDLRDECGWRRCCCCERPGGVCGWRHFRMGIGERVVAVLQ
jgi:hypothetical protein